MIFHLAEQSTWESGPPYHPDSLQSEGFIHCSTAAQLVGVANERYFGRTDLLLVTVDPQRLTAPVVYEDCYESGQAFPHIYGTIAPDAVIVVESFRPSDDGSFSWDAHSVTE